MWEILRSPRKTLQRPQESGARTSAEKSALRGSQKAQNDRLVHCFSFTSTLRVCSYLAFRHVLRLQEGCRKDQLSFKNQLVDMIRLNRHSIIRLQACDVICLYVYIAISL